MNRYGRDIHRGIACLGGAAGDIPRRILEAVAVEGYRSKELSRGPVSELLGLNFRETEAFLKEHEANLHYSKEDLEHDDGANQEVLGT